MNWHRNNAIKTAYRNRKLKAHIIDHSRYGNKALCGRNATVYINAVHVGNDANNVCKACKKLSGITGN